MVKEEGLSPDGFNPLGFSWIHTETSLDSLEAYMGIKINTPPKEEGESCWFADGEQWFLLIALTNLYVLYFFVSTLAPA